MFDFFFLLLFLFGVAVFLRMDWIYYVIYVVGGIWIFSHWWIRRSLAKMEVVRRVPPRAFAGEDIEEELVLRNYSRLPVPWLRLQEAVPMNLRATQSYRIVVNVGGRGITRQRFPLHCHRRGYFQVGPLRLFTGDLFGFAESSWQEGQPAHITVYPRVMTLAELGLPSRLPFGDLRTQQRLFLDPTRMAGVRPYASGDSLRHIHWRASAHEDELLVKKYQPSIALTTTVILDLYREAFPWRERFSSSEWGIVIAASLAKHIAEQRQEIGLITNGFDPVSTQEAAAIPAQSGQGHLMTILETLARVELRGEIDEDIDEDEDKVPRAQAANGPSTPNRPQAADQSDELPPYALERWLPRKVAALGWGTTLMLVTPHVSATLLWQLHTLYRRGLNILAIVCAQQEDFRQIQQQAKPLGIEIYQIIWDADLAKLHSDRRVPVKG